MYYIKYLLTLFVLFASIPIYADEHSNSELPFLGSWEGTVNRGRTNDKIIIRFFNDSIVYERPAKHLKKKYNKVSYYKLIGGSTPKYVATAIEMRQALFFKPISNSKLLFREGNNTSKNNEQIFLKSND